MTAKTVWLAALIVGFGWLIYVANSSETVYRISTKPELTFNTTDGRGEVQEITRVRPEQQSAWSTGHTLVLLAFGGGTVAWWRRYK